jgi:hypothetical protein
MYLANWVVTPLTLPIVTGSLLRGLLLMGLHQSSSDYLNFEGWRPHHMVAVSVPGTKWTLNKSPDYPN